MSNEQKDSKPRSIARSAAVMGIGTFFSRIAGLLREQTFAYLFGAGIWTDAFNVAFRIPNLLRDLFAEGAMSAAFVPTFNGIAHNQGKEKAFKLTNLTFSALLIVVGTLTVIGIVASPLIVKAIAPEFVNDPQKFDVTVTMTRIMFPFLLAVSWAALAMGMLNSLGEFFIPAIAPAFLNLSMILAGWLICPFAKSFGMPAITGMAIGAMIGGIIQFAVQIPSLWKHGFRFKWQLDFNDPGIRKIIRLIIPGIVGLAATQTNVAIITILATSQGDGAVSWLSYAFRIMQLPLGLFGVAVAQATLPVISRQAADHDYDKMAETLSGSIRLSTFINLFAFFAIFSLAEPVIKILFEHGRFLASDTAATALALRAYSTGLLFFCLIKILGPAFYALENTKIPVIASISSVLVNIFVNLILIQYYGYWGLALGTGIAAMVNAGILFVMLNKKLGGFARFGLGKALLRILAATSIAGAGMYFACKYTKELLVAYSSMDPESFITTVLSLGTAVLSGIIILYIISSLIKLEEADQARNLIMRKFFKKKVS
ncbi:MAG: murein biosynthesis integral membrane protein MurJ [Candidatus Rifleibacteriota bacterium]